jgi:hypothetical protein
MMSRPATSLVPAVRKKPGETYLNERTGGVSDPESRRSSVWIAPKFTTPRFGPYPSMGIALPNAADVTPGIDDSLS